MDRPLARSAALASALLAAPAMAEPPPPLAIVGEVEAGWTSNATDSALGGGDYYLIQRHALEFGGAGAGVELRGALRVEETRFRLYEFENDQAAGFHIEGGVRAEDGLVIRGALSLEGSSTGETLVLGPLVLAARTPRIELGARLEAGHETEARAVLVGAELRLTGVGDSELADLGVAARLDPHVALAGLGATWRERLSPEIALAATAGVERTLIAEADRLAFGRPEVGHLSARLGIEAEPLRWLALGAEGGAHALWSEQLPDAAPMLASFRAAAALRLDEVAALTVEHGRGVSLADPADGFAGVTERTAVALSLTPVPALTLGVEAFREDERGVLLPALRTETRGAALAAGLALGDMAGLSLRLAHTETDDGVAPYETRTVSLGVTGRLTP